MEKFRDIKGFEGFYEVSSKGHLKSLARKDSLGRQVNERILKPSANHAGYLGAVLCKEGVRKTLQIHQLVAIAFLNHEPSGHELVVNHINHNKQDNRVENLEIVTHRENSNKKHLKSTSKYVGVSWAAHMNKWVSHICINSRLKYLGYFTEELKAHEAYQSALREILA